MNTGKSKGTDSDQDTGFSLVVTKLDQVVSTLTHVVDKLDILDTHVLDKLDKLDEHVVAELRVLGTTVEDYRERMKRQIVPLTAYIGNESFLLEGEVNATLATLTHGEIIVSNYTLMEDGEERKHITDIDA